MSDTPELDAFLSGKPPHVPLAPPLIEFADRLERRLAAAIRERDELKTEVANLTSSIEWHNDESIKLRDKLIAERDEAIRELDEAREWSKAGKESAAIASAEIMRLTRERDDARAACLAAFRAWVQKAGSSVFVKDEAARLVERVIWEEQ